VWPDANFDTWLNAIGQALELVGALVGAARFLLFEAGVPGQRRGERLAHAMSRQAGVSGQFGQAPANRAHALLTWGTAWIFVAALCALLGVTTEPTNGFVVFVLVVAASVLVGVLGLVGLRLSGAALVPQTSRFVRFLYLFWLPVGLTRAAKAAPWGWLAARPRTGGIYRASRLERAVGFLGRHLDEILGWASATFASGVALELLAIVSPTSWW